RVLAEEVVLDGPDRVPAPALRRDRLLERLVVGAPLAVGVPRTRDRDLAEEPELHRARRYSRAGSGAIAAPGSGWRSHRQYRAPPITKPAHGMPANSTRMPSRLAGVCSAFGTKPTADSTRPLAASASVAPTFITNCIAAE